MPESMTRGFIMRAKWNLTAAWLLVLAAGQPASASGIVTKYSGKVGGNNTIDTYGLFGKPGANLNGLPFSYKEQYAPAEFGSAMGCNIQNNCLYYDTIDGSISSAVIISVTINGIMRAYKAKHSGQAEFTQFSPDLWTYDLSADGDLNRFTGTGVSLVVYYVRPTVFGIRPTRPAIFLAADRAIFYQGKQNNPEEIDFLIERDKH